MQVVNARIKYANYNRSWLLNKIEELEARIEELEQELAESGKNPPRMAGALDIDASQ